MWHTPRFSQSLSLRDSRFSQSHCRRERERENHAAESIITVEKGRDFRGGFTETREMSFQDLEAGRGRSLASSRNINGGGRQDTTQAVASGIFQINTSVSSFQRLVNTLGTPKDTPELRDKL